MTVSKFQHPSESLGSIIHEENRKHDRPIFQTLFTDVTISSRKLAKVFFSFVMGMVVFHRFAMYSVPCEVMKLYF